MRKHADLGVSPRPAATNAPSDETDPQPYGQPRFRLRSVDAFRGATLALMLVTPATGPPDQFPILRHAHWNGLTVSDVVFPTFLVTSGLSLAFLLRHPLRPGTTLRLARRLMVLVVLGLAYNAYGATGLDLGRLRFTGVLQTIGFAGALAAAAVLAARRRDGSDRTGVLIALAVALPAGYGTWWALSAPCEPAGACSPHHPLDVAVFGAGHVYRAGTVGWDPEGIAATTTTAALVLVGYLSAGFVVRHRDRVLHASIGLGAVGIALIGVGRTIDQLQPVNKRLLTPAFLACAAGIALVGFAVFLAAFDGPRRSRRGTNAVAWPLVALGRNALIVYLLERLIVQSAAMVHHRNRTVAQWLIEDVLPIGAPGVHLAYTALLLGLILAVTGMLHRTQRYLAL